jgi:carbonic anhydrase
LHKDELDAISDEDTRYRKLVDLNVQEQCVNLMNNPDVQKAVKVGKLQVHDWVFDIHCGNLVDLKVDFEKTLNGISKIYQIES